jgi:hypothetical protein
MATTETRVCSDQQLWELLNGLESRRPERLEELLARLRATTKGVSTHADIELVVRVVEQ